MLSVKIICVGKLGEKFWAQACAEYQKRLSAYCKMEVLELPEQRLGKDASQGEIEAALEKERQAIQSRIPAGAAVIAMCVEGQLLSSEALAESIEGLALKGASRLCFLIGGSHGLSENLKKQAQIRLSMSRMTFPHHLARVMVLEQIYRAMNITGGGKYHK